MIYAGLALLSGLRSVMQVECYPADGVSDIIVLCGVQYLFLKGLVRNDCVVMRIHYVSRRVVGSMIDRPRYTMAMGKHCHAAITLINMRLLLLVDAAKLAHAKGAVAMYLGTCRKRWSVVT